MLSQRTDRAWFSHLLYHVSRKWSRSNLSTLEPTWSITQASKTPELHGCVTLPMPYLRWEQIHCAAMDLLSTQSSTRPMSLGQPWPSTKLAVVDESQNLKNLLRVFRKTKRWMTSMRNATSFTAVIQKLAWNLKRRVKMFINLYVDPDVSTRGGLETVF